MKHLVQKHLKSTNHNIQIDVFENTYLSHPNFPSLLAITDSLNQLEIENIAANVPFKHIEQLPKFFIAELNLESQDYYLISKNENNILIENENGIVKKSNT